MEIGSKTKGPLKYFLSATLKIIQDPVQYMGTTKKLPFFLVLKPI